MGLAHLRVSEALWYIGARKPKVWGSIPLGTQNFLFVSRSWQYEKHLSLFLPSSKLNIYLIMQTIYSHPHLFREKNFVNYLSSYLTNWFCNLLCIAAPLGSILELPAMSCQEIKASEGKDSTSNKYWLNPTGNGKTELMFCDMNLGTGG